MSTKSWWIFPAALLAALALFCGGFFVGRGAEPAEVKTTDRLEERSKLEERSTAHEKIDAIIEEVKKARTDVAKNVEKTKTTTKRPDGTVVVEEKSRDLSKTETQTSQTRVETITVEKIVEVEKLVEVVKVETHERVVTSRPKWLVGINAGVSVPALLGRQVPSYLPGVPAAAVIGVSVERHLFWGIYGGVFANSQGVIGASGRGAF